MKKHSHLKKAATFCTFLVLLTRFVYAGEPHTIIFKADTSASKLTWVAKKVGGKHEGIIKISQGNIQNNHGAFTGTFIINMNTIENTDIEPGKSRTKLETHLKSADFFDTQKFPESKFVITSISGLQALGKDGATHQVKGNMTIKGITNEISFDAKIVQEGFQLTCDGTAIVDRTLFDIKYGSKKFFENIGDKMIEDEFSVTFHIIAIAN
jgi:polyisoprenoid-binding protein YceI